MRNYVVIIITVFVSGCAATKQEVVQQLGAQYIGKNVDALVAQFGPPAAAFQMNSGDTSYIWQLSNFSIVDYDRGSGTGETRYCKVSVIAAPAGVVRSINTEDSDLRAGPMGLPLFNFGSICARRLGLGRAS